MLSGLRPRVFDSLARTRRESVCRLLSWRVSEERGARDRSELTFSLVSSDHPYFAGLQAHPEFCTRPLNPSPAFLGFVAASAGCLEEQFDRQKDYVPPVSPVRSCYERTVID